ncbi:Crp/Fnr family transcriptional regulator [Lewinella sp. W8]|uniref:Crp/Fnr family transcriptional regulator n=1 Tax=Lewinella sp. W8 TaxID=2528208 RepID=UPI0010681BD4|nr:Crp/Fnr family transcriptional regulator [Lewinella sp. W8]MTB49974.1 helix-turn-helix domain-containing protein [Lewinella sp. W8]
MNLSHAYLQRFFPRLTDGAVREDILRVGFLQQVEAGAVILREEQHIDFVPLIARGGVKVSMQTRNGKHLFLYFIRPGETCTMTLSSCIRREISRVVATSITDTDVVLIPAQRIYDYTRHYPGWNDYVLEAYREKFDSILDGFEQLASTPFDQRVMNYLEHMAAMLESRELLVSHATLAEDLGASRVGISRVLKGLERAGKLRLGRERISLR